jgi:hypothetical protein
MEKTFQFSDNPNFEKKLEDIVGYPPQEDRIVLSIDEQSSIQGFERIQLIDPVVPECQRID